MTKEKTMIITDRDPGDEDMAAEDLELLRAIASFENGEYTPEERAEIEVHEARINEQLRKDAKENALLLAWSKVHGANKVYR
jgi:hypothetical protein